GVEVVREARGAADAGDEHDVLAAQAEVGQEALDRGEDRVVTAPGAPAHLLVRGVLLAVLRLVVGRHAGQAGERQLNGGHLTASISPVLSVVGTSPVVWAIRSVIASASSAALSGM